MIRYLFRRVLQMVPLLLGITILTFILVNVVPGSPFAAPRDQDGRQGITRVDVDRVSANFGLDQPLHTRYFVWLGNMLQGDLGNSIRNSTPVSTLILQKLPNTIILTATALVLSLVIAIPVGVYSALRRNSWFDNGATAVSVAAFSMPTFWLALMLILIIAVKFREWGWPYLPAGGAYDLRAGDNLPDRIKHLILPAFALAFVDTAGWARYIRSQMLEVLMLDFVRTARAKGLRERAVILRHAFRNAILPLITLLGMALPSLFGGAVIIEQIFSYPGMGNLALTAAINKDYPLVMGTVLFAAVLVLVGNLLADVCLSIVDPRVRLG
jgi:peptide/nickel transport system permease protein